jgi:hypothetical protein
MLTKEIRGHKDSCEERHIISQELFTSNSTQDTNSYKEKETEGQTSQFFASSFTQDTNSYKEKETERQTSQFFASSFTQHTNSYKEKETERQTTSQQLFASSTSNSHTI